MNYLISIIVPTYNRAHLIVDTIESILNQTYANLEVLIIDDHSTDNTEDLVLGIKKNDNRVFYYKRPDSKPKGANACRNYGFYISKGAFIKWIDSDDLLHSNAIETQLNNLLSSNAYLSICKTKKFYVISDLSGPKIEEWSNISLELSVNNYILNGFRWHTSAGLWRRSWFNSDLIWDETLMNSQEWFMHFVQLCDKITVSKVDEFLTFARFHQNNMSNKKQKRGSYYFHECKARKKAIEYGLKTGITEKIVFAELARKFIWYYFFIIYKGAPIKALRFSGTYIHYLLLYLFPSIFIKTNNSR